MEHSATTQRESERERETQNPLFIIIIINERREIWAIKVKSCSPKQLQ